MSRLVHGGRALLNLPGHHSTAAIVAEIDNTEGKDFTSSEGYALVPQTTCKITDCDQAVNIEFDVQTANQLENSLHKIDAMIEALMDMRDGMVIEHHRFQDRLDAHPDPTSLFGVRTSVGKRSDIKPPTRRRRRRA